MVASPPREFLLLPLGHDQSVKEYHVLVFHVEYLVEPFVSWGRC